MVFSTHWIQRILRKPIILCQLVSLLQMDAYRTSQDEQHKTNTLLLLWIFIYIQPLHWRGTKGLGFDGEPPYSNLYFPLRKHTYTSFYFLWVVWWARSYHHAKPSSICFWGSACGWYKKLSIKSNFCHFCLGCAKRTHRDER